MVRAELEEAMVALDGLPPSDDARKIIAVIVMLEEVAPEFAGDSRKPWRAVPWLNCAIQLLKQVRSNSGTNRAREHISAARDLLTRE